MLRPLSSYSVTALSNWCREWHRWQVGRVNSGSPLERFAIGLYQLKDIMSWNIAIRARQESQAAAIIHFIVVLEMYNIGVEGMIASDIRREEWVTISHVGGWDMLQDLAAAQRQIMYGHKGNFTNRAKTRFKKTELEYHLGNVIKTLMRSIDPGSRVQAFEDATHIMVGGKI